MFFLRRLMWVCCAPVCGALGASFVARLLDVPATKAEVPILLGALVSFAVTSTIHTLMLANK